MSPTPRSDRFVLIALATIFVVTVGWWAAALWPLPAETPEWVLRARAACFGSPANGLPNSGGWILLVGTPLTMLGALFVIAPAELRCAAAEIRQSTRGAWKLAGALGLVLGLAVLATWRVADLYGFGAENLTRGAIGTTPAKLSRLSRVAPPLELVDHRGRLVRLEDFRGRPVILTFAYGKCETVCPVIVHNVVAAHQELEAFDPVTLIVTIDPWRDTPQRLPHIAASWNLPEDGYVVGGPVDQVETTLDAWGIQRSRDSRTGEIAHASIAFVIDRDGRIAFATSGAQGQLTDAFSRLEVRP